MFITWIAIKIHVVTSIIGLYFELYFNSDLVKVKYEPLNLNSMVEVSY